MNQHQIPRSSYLQSLAAIDTQREREAGQGDKGDSDDEDYGDREQHSRADTDDGRGSEVQIADPGYAQAVATELQETVKYWSDFLKVHVHPRSLHTLERVNRCDSFDCYFAGTEAFKTDRAIDESVDACRRFLEVRFADHVDQHDSVYQAVALPMMRPVLVAPRLDTFAVCLLILRVHAIVLLVCMQECDLLQGFQILADTDTAWGGVAVELLEYLRDDYRGTPMVALATAEHGGFEKQHGLEGEQDGKDHAAAERRRPLNAALSMAGLAEHASVVVPVHCTGFGAATGTLAQYHVSFPTNADYNTSAVAAAAMETATLPYRLLAHQRARMSDMTSVLVSSGDRRPIPLCSLEAQIPLDWHQLVLDVEGTSTQQLPFDDDLASRYIAKMFDNEPRSSANSAERDRRCWRSSVRSFTPQFEKVSQLLPAGAAWETWNHDQLCDVYTVRGLDLRLRRGVAAPATSMSGRRQHHLYARNSCTTFVGGTLALPLCFPPVLHNCPPDAHGTSVSARGTDRDGAADPVLRMEPEAEPEPEPEPEPELERDSASRAGLQLLHEASVATRLTTAPAGLFSMVHASREVVRVARARQSPGLMAAVGGAGIEGLEQLREVEEVVTSMRDCLYDSLHVDSGEMEACDDDDY